MTIDPPPLRSTEHCRHYEYDHGPKCARGIVLDGSVVKCLPGRAVREMCDKREEYTAEERKEWRAWAAARMMRVLALVAEVPGSSRDKKNRSGWGDSGTFSCPTCGGVVRWSRSRVNGHAQAACATEHCSSFME